MFREYAHKHPKTFWSIAATIGGVFLYKLAEEVFSKTVLSPFLDYVGASAVVRGVTLVTGPLIIMVGVLASIAFVAYETGKAERKDATAISFDVSKPSIPDWPICDLLRHLEPNLPFKPEKAWMNALGRVEDAFSTGALNVWGRKERSEGRSSLEPISQEYWRDADLLAWSADPHWCAVGGRCTERRSFHTGWQYSDLRVRKSEALALFPEPLVEPLPPGEWKGANYTYKQPRVLMSEVLSYNDRTGVNDRAIHVYDLPSNAVLNYSIETEPKVSTWKMALGLNRLLFSEALNPHLGQEAQMSDHAIVFYADSTTQPSKLTVRVLLHSWRQADVKQTA